MKILTYTSAVKLWMLSDTNIIVCSVKTFDSKSTIISGVNIWKIIGPKYSIDKNWISNLEG